MIPYMNVDLRSINLHYDQRMNWMLNNHQRITEERQQEKSNPPPKEKPQINLNQSMPMNPLHSRSVSLGVQTDSDLVQSYERSSKGQATGLINSFPPHPTMIPIAKEEAAIRSLRASSNSMPTDYERNLIARLPIDEHHLAQLGQLHPHPAPQPKTEPGPPPYYAETDFDTNYYSKLMSAFLIQDCNPLRTFKDQAGIAVLPNGSHFTDGDGKTRVSSGFDVRNPTYSLYNDASSLFSQNSVVPGEVGKPNEGHTVNRKPNAIVRLGGEEVMCEVCDKKFPHIWLLKIHSTKHTGRRLRTCELCSKAFVSAFGGGGGGSGAAGGGRRRQLPLPPNKQPLPTTDTNYDARLYNRTAFPAAEHTNSETSDFDRVTGLYRAAFPGECDSSNDANNRAPTERLYRDRFADEPNNRNEQQPARNVNENQLEPGGYSRDNPYQHASFDKNNVVSSRVNTNVGGTQYNPGQLYERETFTNSSNNRTDSSHTDCNNYSNVGEHNRNEVTGANRSNVSASEISSLSPAPSPSTSSTTSMSLCSSSSPSASIINHINKTTTTTTTTTTNNNGLVAGAGSGTHHCDLCNRLYTAAAAADGDDDDGDDLHSTLSYGKVYTCDVCNRSYSTLGNLKQHKEKHYGEKNFVCEKCNKSFFTAGNLKQHLITHTGEKSFLCKLCNKTYSTSGNLRQHLLTHTGQKTNFCVICNRSFSTLGNLKQHMLTHFATNLYPCEVCKKSYSTLGNLKQHMLTHTGQKIFPCDKCDKTFTTLGNAKQHMIRHSGEKPYVCQTCCKSFFTLGNLKQHALTHSEEKLYKCDKCNKSFYTLSNLKQHSATHSDIKKTYVCEICSRSFSTFGNLKQHKLKHSLNISQASA